MVAASWGWKRVNSNKNTMTGTPDEEGQYGEHRDHDLYAIEGHFGERLFWECENCGETQRYARDIDFDCPEV